MSFFSFTFFHRPILISQTCRNCFWNNFLSHAKIFKLSQRRDRRERVAPSLQSHSGRLSYRIMPLRNSPCPPSASSFLMFAQTKARCIWFSHLKKQKNSPALMVSSTRRRLVEVWHRKTSVALKNCKCFSSHLLCTDEMQDTWKEKKKPVGFWMSYVFISLHCCLWFCFWCSFAFFSCNQQSKSSPPLSGVMQLHYLNVVLPLFHCHLLFCQVTLGLVYWINASR